MAKKRVDVGTFGIFLQFLALAIILIALFLDSSEILQKLLIMAGGLWIAKLLLLKIMVIRE